MTLFVGSMILLSVIVAKIMANNLGQDDSKERFKLTKDYKKYKDIDYKYDAVVGKKLYANMCASCHRADGLGAMIAPPLAGSQIVQNEQDKLLKIVVKGLKGEITRNGKSYNSSMPGFKIIPHEDLAHVINYIKNSFGNTSDAHIPTVEIIKTKIDTLIKKGAYLESEL